MWPEVLTGRTQDRLSRQSFTEKKEQIQTVSSASLTWSLWLQLLERDSTLS